MPGRPVLSEEAEREEATEREEFYRAEGKIRELRGRRQSLVDEVRQLSAEQKALYDARQPGQQALEATHSAHQELGRALGDLRRQRDGARAAMEQALVALREFRADLPKGDHPHPEQIRREIRDLEMRQQTTALPIAEENQLIDRLRSLTRQLSEAEKSKAAVDDRQRKLKELDLALATHRAEADRLQHELGRAHAERDRTMQSMRDQLVQAGKLVAELREKGRRRADVMAKLDAMNRDVMGLEREADRLAQRSRDRHNEAKQTVRDYNRNVRESVSGERAFGRTADAQLEELMKRGKITLG